MRPGLLSARPGGGFTELLRLRDPPLSLVPGTTPLLLWAKTRGRAAFQTPAGLGLEEEGAQGAVASLRHALRPPAEPSPRRPLAGTRGTASTHSAQRKTLAGRKVPSAGSCRGATGECHRHLGSP